MEAAGTCPGLLDLLQLDVDLDLGAALLDDLGDGVGELVQLHLQQRVELQLGVHDEGLAADGPG